MRKIYILSDRLDSLSVQHQRAFALIAAERMFVARSLIIDRVDSSETGDFIQVMDQLWQLLIRDDEMSVDEHETYRLNINALRPSKLDDHKTFPLRDVCWILKSVLNVFRERDHAFEIGRLGLEMATKSKLDEIVEVDNLLEIANMLEDAEQIDDSAVAELREAIRQFPLAVGSRQPQPGRD